MSATNPTIREDLNTGVLQRIADDARKLGMGDLIGLLVDFLTDNAPTETGLNPNASAQVITLADTPATMFNVKSTAGAGTLGTLALLRGPISGAGALSPDPGEVVWNGGTGLLFNAADAFTAVDVLYSSSTTPISASALDRTLEQRDVS